MKSVCILGTAPSWVSSPDNIETWGCAPAAKYIDRTFKHLFELHDKDYYNGELARISSYNCDVFFKNKVGIKNAIVFPFEKMLAYYAGYNGQKFYTSSISYMLAYAIFLEDYTEIFLYGCDMREEDGYKSQIKAIIYWIGVAEGRGIKVTIAQSSTYFKIPYMYAYEKENEIVIRAIIRNEQLINDLKKMKNGEMPQSEERTNKIKGAIQQNNEWIRKYSYD